MRRPRLRLGMIGCGRIVEEGHLQGYRQCADLARVCALADPSTDRRGHLGGLLGVGDGGRYAEAERMLERESLDGVVVATPPAQHLPVIQAALASGCSVLVEKPLCLGLTELAAIEAAAEASAGTVAVIHNYLHQSGWKAFIQRVHQGDAGRPVLLRISEKADGHWDEGIARATWRGELGLGGGPLYENVYHALYLAEKLLMSPVTGGIAQVVDLLKGYPSGDVALVTLKHQSGAITQILISWCYRGHAAAVAELAGENGVLRYRYWEDPGRLELDSSGKTREFEVEDAGDDDGYGETFRRWLRSLRHRHSPPVDLNEGRRMLEILASLERSSLDWRHPNPRE